MDSLIFSINTVVPVFLVIVAGMLLKKLNILNYKFSETASKFVFLIAFPALLFMNIANSDFSGIFNRELLYTIIFSVISTLVIFLLLVALTKRFISDESIRGSFIQGAFRGNFALLGIPLIFNIAASEGVIIASLIAAFIIPLYNILSIIALSFHKKTSINLMFVMIIKNPLIIATAFGITVSVLGIKLPLVLTRTIDMFSVIAIPIALLSIGVFFDLGKFMTGIRHTMPASIIKTVLTPIVFTPLSYLFGIRGIHLAALFILFAAPTAISSHIMAKGMGADENTAAGIIILSTAVSVIVLFIGFFLIKQFGIV